MPDAAGSTRTEVAGLSLREEYDVFRSRYEHMQELLRDAQLQVHDGEWEWNGDDDLPIPGGNEVAPLPGSDTENSYDIATSPMWSPTGATGDKRDDRDVRGVTGNGWQLFSTVQTNGRYTLDVSSESFWTNDVDALSSAVFGRSTMTSPPPSRPGVSPPFPAWDAAIVNHPEI